VTSCPDGNNSRAPAESPVRGTADRLRLLVGLAPRPTEEAETGDDAQRSDDGPERTAGHRRSVDQAEPLPEPYRAGHEQQPSDHAPDDGHGIHYAEYITLDAWASQLGL
jgi:hypothetical protein